MKFIFMLLLFGFLDMVGILCGVFVENKHWIPTFLIQLVILWMLNYLL